MTRKLAVKVREVAAEYGATVSIEEGRKHDRINIALGGRTRFVVCSHSPSDCFAEKKIVADVKREIARIA